mgnify:CR=1 FL=1
MKYLWILLMGLALGGGLFSCTQSSDEELLGNWIRRSDFEGVPRSNAVSFVIGNYAYVGLGYDGEDDLQDFWRYDPTLDFWTIVDTFPGKGRRAAVAFSVGNLGYVGTGFNGDAEASLTDFWVFDPEAASGEQWKPIADFPGSGRYNAVAFSANDRGYVGTGFDNSWLKDFYEYDPSTDSWTQIVSLGGSKREDAVAFSIGNTHYIGTGRNNGAYEYDFWEFLPEEKQWNRKTDIDEDDDYQIARHAAAAFSLDDKGYIATGTNVNNLTSVWEYDATTDSWEEKSAFEGVARADAVAFTVMGRAFITTGRSGSLRLDDLREFKPNDVSDDDD